MSAPDAATMREAIEKHVELWNAGDKDAWLAAWRSAAKDITMDDPVGTPTKHGWDVMAKAFDMSAADWKLAIGTMYVCGNAVAAVVRNERSVDGNPTTVESIEVYKFDDDGSVHGEVYYDLADSSPEWAEWTAEAGKN